MSSKKKIFFVLVVIGTTTSSFAGETVVKACGLSLLNALHKLEGKSPDPLEITEFKLTKDASYIFGNQKLNLGPVPLAREIFGVYRRKPIAKATLKVFSETKFTAHIPDENFTTLLKPNTFYTYVIHDDMIRFAQTRPGFIRDIGSKHAILRAYDRDLRLAGEFWVDGKGKFHFDGSSGTFQPTNAQTKTGIQFFQENLKIKDAEVHYYNPPAPRTPAPVDQSLLTARKILYTRATLKGSKFLFSDAEEHKQIENLNEKLITISSANGESKQFKVVKGASVTTSNHYYDTPTLTLKNKKAELKTTTVHESNEKLKFSPKLDPDSEAVTMAKKFGVKASDLRIVDVVSDKETEMLVYPVTKSGVTENDPAFVISLSEKSIKGKPSIYSSNVETIDPKSPASRDLASVMETLKTTSKAEKK